MKTNKADKIINLIVDAIAPKVTTMSNIVVKPNTIHFGVGCNNMTTNKAVAIRTAIHKAICKYNAYCPVFPEGDTKLDGNHHSIIVHYL